MKKVNFWQKSLAILSIATLTCLELTVPRQTKAIIVEDSDNQTESVEFSIPVVERISPPSLTANVTSIPIYVPPPQTSISRGFCPDFFAPAIDYVVDSSTYATGKWGVHIESLKDGKVLYSHNANSFLIPASNVKILTTAAALQKLGPQTTIRSKSLWHWIIETNLRSNNSYANVLLRYIGGAEAVKQSLGSLGINPSGFRQVDGSGLSRGNQATPRTIVDTLKVMNNAQGKDLFYESLPLAGVSGTLRRRFRSTPVQGKVRAKTGTLRGVRALSGYMEHPEYGRVVFSIMVNQSSQSGSTLIWGVDQIVLRLSQLSNCR